MICTERDFLSQELDGGIKFEGPMRPLSVVPDEPRNQLTVKLIRRSQQLLMVVDELFLNRAIKPFHVGVHLGSFGIGMPVVFMQSSDFSRSNVFNLPDCFGYVIFPQSALISLRE
jgi:hypothetical protein